MQRTSTNTSSAPRTPTSIRDALGSLAGSENGVHFLDVSGQVQTNATPGLLPDTGSNSPTLQPTVWQLGDGVARP